MSIQNSKLVAQLGPKRARFFLVLAALLFVVLILGCAAVLMRDALQTGRKPWALGIGVLALLALSLWLRIVWAQWAALTVETDTIKHDHDETGVWGVGGPNVRIPGATGIFRVPRDSQSPSEQDHRDHEP